MRAMRAITCDKFGGPEVLHLRRLPPPQAGPGEVLIRVAYSGVNPVDWKIREGLLQSALPHQFPLIPGWDAAGEIAALGEGVTRFEPGQTVYAYCRKPVVQWGTYAELVTMDARAVALMPRALSVAEAAGVPLAALTAWQALHDFARLAAGQRVLVQAGAGGVGGFAIQFAKVAGAEVTTTASHEKHEYVRSLGADRVIDYRREDFVAASRRAVPEGFDLVFDTVGGETLDKSWDVVRRAGTLVSIVATPDAERAAKLGVRSGYHFVSPNGKQLAEITNLIDAGKVRAPRVEVIPLERAALAQEKSRSGRTVGKIVLQVG